MLVPVGITWFVEIPQTVNIEVTGSVVPSGSNFTLDQAEPLQMM